MVMMASSDASRIVRCRASLLAQRGLGPLAIGDVAGDGGGPQNPPFFVHQRRDGQCHVDLFPVFPQADCFALGNLLSPRELRENVHQLVGVVGRDQHGDGLADRFLGGIAVELLGPVVPTEDDPFEGLGDDRIFRRFDDGCQAAGGFLRLLAIGDVQRGPHKANCLANPLNVAELAARSPPPIASRRAAEARGTGNGTRPSHWPSPLLGPPRRPAGDLRDAGGKGRSGNPPPLPAACQKWPCSRATTSSVRSADRSPTSPIPWPRPPCAAVLHFPAMPLRFAGWR